MLVRAHSHHHTTEHNVVTVFTSGNALLSFPINIGQISYRLLNLFFHVKGAVLKVDDAVDLGSVPNEIFNEPMFCAVGQLLATLLGFVEVHLG